MSENEKRDVAVFFDFENIVFSLRNAYGINANFEDLMDKCKEFGRVVVARAFADWNRHSSSMIPALMSNGFDPVYVPSFYTNEAGQKDLRKNAVDMYMAIDAMDVLHTRKSVDLFILLTGDSDFLPVVNAARREGNEVIAIGVDGSSSSHLAQAVDEFIFYSQVSSMPASTFKKRPTDIYEGLIEAVRRLNKEKRSPVLPNIKMKMAELLGGFDEKKHSDPNGRRFQKFKEFVMDAEQQGLVKLVSTGSVNEVFIVDEEGDSKKSDGRDNRDNRDGRDSRDNRDNRESRNKRDKSSNRDKSDNKGSDKKGKGAKPKKTSGPLTVKQAFDLLVNAVESAAKEGKSLRSSSIKGVLTSMVDNFAEKDIQAKDGSNPFAKFSEFTAAAEEKGLIKLVGESTHQEVWLPHMEESPTPAKKAPEADKMAPEAETAAKAPEAEAKAEVKVEAKAEAKAPVDAKPDFAERQLIIDSIQSFDKYPASFLQIEAHCRHIRNERSMDVASKDIRTLLTEAARDMRLLKRASARGESPTKYALNFDAGRASKFLGVTVEAPPEAKTEEVVAEVVEETKETVEAVAEAAVVEAVEEKAEDAAPAEATEEKAPAKTAKKEPAKKAKATAKAPKQAKAKVEEAAKEVKVEETKVEEETADTPFTISEACGVLLTAVGKAEADGKSLRFSAIKKRMKALRPGFDEGQFTGENGKPFKRFSDFVKHAEAQGFVTIEGKGVQAKVHSVNYSE